MHAAGIWTGFMLFNYACRYHSIDGFWDGDKLAARIGIKTEL